MKKTNKSISDFGLRIANFAFVLISLAFSQSAEEILQRVDYNMVVTSAGYSAVMRISIGGEIREKEFLGYTRGKDYAYIEFTAPARDKGTRFLKIGREMWMYLPSVEKATRIAGHMLRQSLMGSDFSYDDVTENRSLNELYNAEITGIDTIDGRECYILELFAKVEEVNYYTRKIWVDKSIYIPVKAELYAKSGKLMKEVYNSEFKKIGTRTYPTKTRMVNRLRQNTFTELILKEIKLDIQIPEKIFTKSYLERK